MPVFVVDNNGQPQDPCSPARAGRFNISTKIGLVQGIDRKSCQFVHKQKGWLCLQFICTRAKIIAEGRVGLAIFGSASRPGSSRACPPEKPQKSMCNLFGMTA
jgi:hypothetical protein